MDAGLAAELLERLISRYLVDPESPLGLWSQSRVGDEVAVRIDTLVVPSWDYSTR